MNDRRTFLQSSVGGLLTASVLPHPAVAQESTDQMASEPKVVSAQDGTRIWAMGVLVTVKVRAADTGGAYSVFEDFIPPGAGPVPHTHSREDETIFVLEGKLRAWLGGKQYDVQSGDFVHMPRGVQHYFKNVSDQPTRLLLTYTPGGFEQWFVDIGKPVTDDSRVAPEITADDIRLAVTQAQKYGVKFSKP